MIRSVLYLRAKNGNAQALVDAYRDHGILERALLTPGCLGSDIEVPIDPSEPVLVTALWDSPEAYQRWVDDPWRAGSTGLLSPFLETDLNKGVRGQLYKVGHAVGASGTAEGATAG